jgi:LysM repeat protein
MSRKDTILIAVIINAGLLAILFATAIIYDTDKLIDHTEFDTSLAEASQVTSDSMKLIASHQPQDEMDRHVREVEPVVPSLMEQEELYFQDPDVNKVGQTDYIEMKSENINPPKGDFVEVTVKKGDSLEKIARANSTTISAIKKANQLNSERLSIGQMLKIPLKKDQAIEQAPIVAAPPPVVKPSSNQSEAVYHTVKSGDNPWKIAKQYGVKYEDILRLNHLDEDKARNLKIGDRIRVK